MTSNEKGRSSSTLETARNSEKPCSLILADIAGDVKDRAIPPPKVHEAASIFPLLEGADFDALVTDIKTNGLREPIWTLDEKILDGRNRFRACSKAGVEPTFREWTDGGDPVAFVLSLNLHRRHLNESQRAMVSARIATMGQGARTDLRPIGLKSQSESAALLNVSERSTRRAQRVIEDGTPDLVAAVDQGHLAVSAAATFSKQPAARQAVLVGHVLAGARPQEAKRRLVSSLAAEAGKLPETKYRVLYADPPWSYSNTPPEGTTEARDHYSTMSMDELEKLPVSALAEDDAVLFLWVTSPILPEALDLAKAWGFTYKASFVWDKIKHNMGHYNSVRHELLLVCVKGSCQPDVRQLFDSVVSVERTEHSAKPEEFRTIIDTIYPHGKRLELFARREAPGWEAWGNDRRIAA